MNLPNDILDMIYLGRISELDTEIIDLGTSKSITSYPDQITDFNLWNKSLKIDEMIEWTNCM